MNHFMEQIYNSWFPYRFMQDFKNKDFAKKVNDPVLFGQNIPSF